jgi:spermidine/putrescine transport system permease protein|tara:strand:- start:1048 stop:1968 length:921 start_codon:yes stop_codon:yes gene_type:complete
MTTTFHNNPGKRKSLPDGGVKPIGRPFWLLSPGVIWLLLFGLAPLAFMLMMSFWTSTIFGTKPDFSFDNYARVIVTDLYRDQLFKTLRIAFMTTVLTVFISYPVAYLLSRLKGMQKALFVLMVFLPFWTSYVIRAFVWLPILGRNGAINNMLQALGVIDTPIDWLLYNEGAVFLGLVYVYTLFMTLPIYLSLEKIDPALIEAATDLGAKPGSIFRRIVLPLSWPGVLSGCIMVFLLSISAFVTPQLLGGASGIMYGNVIASQFLANNNWAFGSALSITLIAIVLVLLLISSRWIGVQHVFTGGRNR